MTLKTLSPLLALFLGTATFASAAEPMRLDTAGKWSAYSYKDGSGASCYVLSQPTEMTPANVDHGRNFFIVAVDGKGPPSYVPQALMGYKLKPGSRVNVTIGDRKFVMFSRENSAWTLDASMQPDMVDAMKSGSDMLVEATSRRGTATSYTYSLDGITATLKAATNCD